MDDRGRHKRAQKIAAGAEGTEDEEGPGNVVGRGNTKERGRQRNTDDDARIRISAKERAKGPAAASRPLRAERARQPHSVPTTPYRTEKVGSPGDYAPGAPLARRRTPPAREHAKPGTPQRGACIPAAPPPLPRRPSRARGSAATARQSGRRPCRDAGAAGAPINGNGVGYLTFTELFSATLRDTPCAQSFRDRRARFPPRGRAPRVRGRFPCAGRGRRAGNMGKAREGSDEDPGRARFGRDDRRALPAAAIRPFALLSRSLCASFVPPLRLLCASFVRLLRLLCASFAPLRRSLRTMESRVLRVRPSVWYSPARMPIADPSRRPPRAPVPPPASRSLRRAGGKAPDWPVAPPFVTILPRGPGARRRRTPPPE
eukprot:gene13166-biopygen6929